DHSIGKYRSIDRWFSRVVDALRREHPAKLAQLLADYTHRDKRVCELWLAGAQSPNGAALASLIRSPIGRIVLDAITAGAEAEWIARDRKARRLLTIHEREAELRREKEQALEGI
ncbi:hypothetical protein, partial [Nitrobacter sp.]